MRLCDLYPLLDREARADLARKASTDEDYLWQIATRWRDKRPSLDLISRLVAADDRLTITDLVQEFSATPTPAEVAEREV